MIITYKKKKIFLKKLQNCLNYLNDVLKENNLWGKLQNINIKNNNLLGNKIKFQEIKRELKNIQILKEVEKFKDNKAPIYNINKSNFIVIYSLVYAINSLTKNDRNIISKNNVSIDIWVLYSKIKKYLKNTNSTYDFKSNSIDIKIYEKILFYSYVFINELYNYYDYKKYNTILFDKPYFKYQDMINCYIKKYINNISKYNVYFSSSYISYKRGVKMLAPYLSSTFLSNDIAYSKCIKDDDELTKLFIKNCDLSSFKDLHISKKLREKYGDKQIIKHYKTFVANNSILIKEIIKTTNSINAKKKIKIYANIDVKIIDCKNGSGMIHCSLRQYNNICDIKKEKRALINNIDSFDGEFDIHSAIFSITKYMNTGYLDLGWDIKNEIIKSGFKDINGKILNVPCIKKILFFIYFCEREKSLNTYKYYLSKDSMIPHLSDETYINIYDTVHSLICNGNKYIKNIFIIESLIELYTINSILDKNCDIRNVYDCFYYKTAQINENDIKSILAESFQKTKELYECLPKYS